MNRKTLNIALISEVFYEVDGPERLTRRLTEAKAQGAELAVLPELPLNPWSPATKQQQAEDAEPPNGPRAQVQSEAARAAGIGLIGGAIIHDREHDARFNTALVFDADGQCVATYCKIHIPEEPGFWETSHYEAGLEPPEVIESFGFPFGVQICSDINRPEGCHLLGAMGAEAILAPRATENATYEKWKPVFIANALTSCAYVLSVNRPRPEQEVLIGGPSIAVAPNGRVLLETTEPIGIVELNRDLIARARVDYPGYLPVHAALYAKAWNRTANQLRPARPVTEQHGIF